MLIPIEGELTLRTHNSSIDSLDCVKCGAHHDPKDLYSVCEKCGGILDPRYDLEVAGEADYPKRSASQDRQGLWRWLTFLPITESASIVSAGEGGTPLLPAKNLGPDMRLGNLFIKDESRNPTGCFKDRGAAVTASKLHQHGVREAVIASEGNAACSLALYAPLASFTCHAFVPPNISPFKKGLLRALGAKTQIVEGTLAEAGKAVAATSAEKGWYNASTFITPYRHDGKGTMAWEILEQSDWKAPDAVIYPVGGGVGLVGMWKAFKYAQTLEWSDKTPRMIGVQPEGCAPVVRAFQEGRQDVEAWRGPSTVASGLLVPKPLGGKLILQAIRESDGTAISVSEEAIRSSVRTVRQKEGLLLEPAAAAAFAALPKLRDSGALDASDRTVVIATGSGLKTPEQLA